MTQDMLVPITAAIWFLTLLLVVISIAQIIKLRTAKRLQEAASAAALQEVANALSSAKAARDSHAAFMFRRAEAMTSKITSTHLETFQLPRRNATTDTHHRAHRSARKLRNASPRRASMQLHKHGAESLPASSS